MSVFYQPPTCPLFDLPKEVLGIVIEKLAEERPWNANAVTHFRLTCKYAWQLGERRRYMHIRIQQPSKYYKLVAVLKNDESRYQWVKSLMLNLWPTAGGLHNLQGIDRLPIPHFISRFTNIKHLEVDTSFWNQWYGSGASFQFTEVWSSWLQTHDFAGLTECRLNLKNLAADAAPYSSLPIERLLKAPKLTTLSLGSLCIQPANVISIPSRSTSLKALRLFRCAVNEQSLAAILSIPAALDRLDLDDGDMYTNRMLTVLLPTVARERPDLRALKVSVCDGGPREREEHRNTFDFTQMINLKELTLWSNGSCLWGSLGWFPINAFRRLPPMFETIRIATWFPGIDIARLAASLLQSAYEGPAFPTSLQLLGCEDAAFDLERPLIKKQHDREETIRKSITRFVTETTLSEVRYKQRGPVRDRRLTAKKCASAGESGSEEKSYELVEADFRPGGRRL
ncbi:hypothetical protein H2200_006961 [Cladophialophora chaetospira]|uniref:F-box domain-containing protein n=1 Tax=Cladophialophora chaetospira TaxID=386627 RepID=A0AA38X9S3_9EURO|nr:hypothetical protein H2200_006961 [Cladophialophora chaetospira]